MEWDSCLSIIRLDLIQIRGIEKGSTSITKLDTIIDKSNHIFWQDKHFQLGYYVQFLYLIFQMIATREAQVPNYLACAMPSSYITFRGVGIYFKFKWLTHLAYKCSTEMPTCTYYKTILECYFIKNWFWGPSKPQLRVNLRIFTN